MATHKLSRKELKHDSFSDWIGRSADWLQANYTKAGIGLLVIIALVIGVRFGVQAQAKARQRAAYDLFGAESYLLRGDFAGARDRLLEIRNRLGNSPLGHQAAHDLAQAQLGIGDRDAALATLDQALNSVPDKDPRRRQMLGLKAVILDAQRRSDDAQAIYRDLLARKDLSDQERYATTLALAGSLQEAGKIQEAIDLLTKLQASINAGELSITSREHETKLQLLKALAGS